MARQQQKNLTKRCLLPLILCSFLISCSGSQESVASYGTRATLVISSTPVTKLVLPQVRTPLLNTVVIIGDSLTVGTELYGTTLTQRLYDAEITNAFVLAENGRTTSEGIDELERFMLTEGVVVLALGTNDVASGTPNVFGEYIDRAVAAVPESVDIYWLNLYTDHWVSDDAYNEIIAQKARVYSNLFVMDFETFASPNWLEEDGVHLTPDGYISRTAFIIAELGLN